jgi:hypothetical protein
LRVAAAQQKRGAARGGKDALAEDFVRFVLAGLDAIAVAHRSEVRRQ